jgi:xanthine phosphoribosyltransferase
MTATPGPRKSFPMSWEELHRDAKAPAGHLLELGPWKGMVAETRGG